MTEQQCGAVLLRMVEMLGAAGAPMRFGDALQCAAIEVGVEVPPDVEEMLLVTAFKIISTGRIPGCPDA